MNNLRTRLAAPAAVALALGLFVFISWQVIRHAVSNERADMLYTLHLRAESLAWAAEGVVRYLGHGKYSLSQMLAELSHQPGIAWIAIVGASGHILHDSIPALKGALLYTPPELAALAPSALLQGRFSPDDHNIYETWKIFSPGRLTSGRRHEQENNILFVALNATSFQEELEDYQRQLWLMAILLLLAAASSTAFFYAIRKYRRSRRNLRDAKALSEQMVTSYPAPLLIASLSGQILLANPAASKMFGHTSGKIQNLQGMDWQFILNELESGQPIIERELCLRLADGATLPVSLSGASIKDADGHPSGYMLAFNNLAEIRQLQRKLGEAERLSALGNLAAGVAHEIRNPLSSIGGYACYLQNRLKDDPLGETTAALLADETRRLDSVLCDLLRLVKTPQLRIAGISLAKLMEKLYKLSMPDAEAKGIELDFTFQEKDAPLLEADRDKLLQALLNILLNAIQATPPHGQVKMDANFLEPANPLIPATVNGNHGAWRITIADNGPGISAENRKQIFTPYFTTRAEGTGLGLTLAKQSIDAHGGAISVVSAPGQGAVFTIIIPAAHAYE